MSQSMFTMMPTGPQLLETLDALRMSCHVTVRIKTYRGLGML